MPQSRDIGLAVIGSGRIGTLRARLASKHPAVRFLAVADKSSENARKLAGKVGADFHTGDNLAAISRPEVNAVIVSTSEDQHTEPVLQALDRGCAVLVEKPLAVRVEDAARILKRVSRNGADVRIGYSRRYKHRYLRVKEQLAQHRIGTIVGGLARLFNLRTQAYAIMDRDRHATPVVDALTYYVDLMGWFLDGNRVVEVEARGQRGALRAAGYDADDIVWAILTHEDGAVVNIGVSYALPAEYPSVGHSARVELLGAEGVILIDDEHTDQIMYTEKGFPHVYLPDSEVNMLFLGSSTPGDWVLGDFWGPLASETRAWLDHIATGQPCALTTPAQAYSNLAVTLAIEQAARERRTVKIDPPPVQ